MCITNQSETDIKQLSNNLIVKKQFKNLKQFEKCGLASNELDALAISTQYTKNIFSKINDSFNNFKKSNLYTILFKTTQPAHVITLLAVLTIAWLLNPGQHHKEVPSTTLNFIYLGSFSTFIGTQIWMTFVSGLALFFSIPRHHFGNVQRVLFPKYFTLNSILSLITLAAYSQFLNAKTWLSTVTLQIVVLTICFLLNLLIRLYLTPQLLKYMELKHKFEEAAGVGMEIGTHNAGPLKYCVQYNKIHKLFRKVHMLIAIGNIITMSCSIIHLYHLSSKLCM